MAADDLLARTPSPTDATRSSTAWAACSAGARGTPRSSRPSARRAPGGAGRAPVDPAVGAAVGARHRPHGRVGQGHRGRAVRRRPAGRRRAGTCGRSARRTPTRASASATSAPLLRPPPGPRPDPRRRRRPGPQPVRDLRDRQGPAGARRGLRPVPRRGRAGARRRRGDRGLDRGRRAADRVGAAAAAARDRRRAGPVRAAAPRGVARATCSSRASSRLGDVDADLAAAAATATGTFETTYVEHAYIEPEAGTARVVDGRVEVFATTQTPYMDRDELALVLGLPEDRVRVIPSACGGGFGGKLDLSLQPLIAIAALAARPPGPRRLSAAGVDGRDDQAPPGQDRGDVRRGRRRAAHRRPRPRRLRHRRLRVVGPDGRQPRAGPRDGPVRGPLGAQHEPGRVHERAAGRGVPRLRRARRRRSPTRRSWTTSPSSSASTRSRSAPRNALRAGSRTATSQELVASAGLPACLDALRPRWSAHARGGGRGQRGRRGPGPPRASGSAAMWYGIGNTSLPNPSDDRGRHPRRRHRRPVLGGDRHRPGLEHDPRPDRRRRAGRAGRVDRARRARHRPHARTPARPRRRARRSCRGTRPGSPPRTCGASS